MRHRIVCWILMLLGLGIGLAQAQQHCDALGVPVKTTSIWLVYCNDADTLVQVQVTQAEYEAAQCRGCGAAAFEVYCPPGATFVQATPDIKQWLTPTGFPQPCDVFTTRALPIWNAAHTVLTVVLPDGLEEEVDMTTHDLVWAGAPGASALLNFSPPLDFLTVGPP